MLQARRRQARFGRAAALGLALAGSLALSIAGAALLILASLPGGLVFLTRRGLMVSAPSSDMS